MPELALTIDDINDAQERIRGQVRRTPCLRARFFRESPGAATLSLKLECLQVSGSFKARGLCMAVSMAKELGLRRVATPTAGNAASGLAPTWGATSWMATSGLSTATSRALAGLRTRFLGTLSRLSLGVGQSQPKLVGMGLGLFGLQLLPRRGALALERLFEVRTLGLERLARPKRALVHLGQIVPCLEICEMLDQSAERFELENRGLETVSQRNGSQSSLAFPNVRFTPWVARTS